MNWSSYTFWIAMAAFMLATLSGMFSEDNGMTARFFAQSAAIFGMAIYMKLDSK